MIVFFSLGICKSKICIDQENQKYVIPTLGLAPDPRLFLGAESVAWTPFFSFQFAARSAKIMHDKNVIDVKLNPQDFDSDL